MYSILKAPQEGLLTLLECRFNILMACFRIIIENVFAEAWNYWEALNHSHNLRLGSMAVGKLFPLAMILSTCTKSCMATRLARALTVTPCC